MVDTLKDKGKGSGLLLALSGSPPSSMSDSDDADPSLKGVGERSNADSVPPELTSGAEEIIEAMQTGDANGFARALQSFVTMCV